ncbi:MAG: spore germination protein [Bacillota bacterium]|nr:spore germination protein [Bacillota bacterium]
MKEKLTGVLKENMALLERLYSPNFVVKQRCFENQRDPRIRCCLLFVDGMTDSQQLNADIIRPIMLNRRLRPSERLLDQLMEEVVFSNEASKSGDVETLMAELLSGNAVLLVEGQKEALMLSARHWTIRSVSEPEAEKVLQGPREGFTESLLVNLSLLRRKLCNPDLKFEKLSVGRQTRTRVSLCYVEGLVNREILEELRKRLERIDIDGVLDANYIRELIRDSAASPFQTTGFTERPDVVAAKLLEGRAALLVDGSPVAVTVPFLFLEYFQTNDDYYSDFYFGSLGRILRILGFVVTISLPAVYLALVTWHQDLLPTRFLLNLFMARQGLPFPTFFEMLLLILAFELIREGGSRIPTGFGQTLSVVGGLILGQASVDAMLVSIPVVIIVAFTGITGLIIPSMKGPILLIRLIWLVLAGLLGLPGYFLGAAALLVHLSGLRTFGLPYTSLLSHSFSQHFTDTVIRAPWNRMLLRPARLSPKNSRRQKDPFRQP